MSDTYKQDISSHRDIERLLKHFYQRVLADEIIGFYFTDIMRFSLDQHLAKVTDFWVQQLFSERVYHGELFKRHQEIHHLTAISQHHFQRWLHLFETSIDELYLGPRCNAMKQRANAIAHAMAKALSDRAEARPAAPGVHFYKP